MGDQRATETEVQTMSMSTLAISTLAGGMKRHTVAKGVASAIVLFPLLLCPALLYRPMLLVIDCSSIVKLELA